MRIRRFVGAAIAAAVMLVPSMGHAVGEDRAKVTGMPCEVGDESLSFSEADSTWIGQSTVTCTADRDNMTINFVVYQVQGVNTFARPYYTGRVAMVSRDPVDPSITFYGCNFCPAVSAFGYASTLPIGLYAMYTQTTITHTSPLTSVTKTVTGYHVSCFVVTGDVEGPAQKIPGCAP